MNSEDGLIGLMTKLIMDDSSIEKQEYRSISDHQTRTRQEPDKTRTRFRKQKNQLNSSSR